MPRLSATKTEHAKTAGDDGDDRTAAEEDSEVASTLQRRAGNLGGRRCGRLERQAGRLRDVAAPIVTWNVRVLLLAAVADADLHVEVVRVTREPVDRQPVARHTDRHLGAGHGDQRGRLSVVAQQLGAISQLAPVGIRGA